MTTPVSRPYRRRQGRRSTDDFAAKVPCPHCGGSTSLVTNSRPVISRNGIRRRRECAECHQRYTTIELLDETHIPSNRELTNAMSVTA
jgi:transcription elongation factor Elf1